MKEIEWFADNKMHYIECCDANFGLFVERDKNIDNKTDDYEVERVIKKKGKNCHGMKVV